MNMEDSEQKQPYCLVHKVDLKPSLLETKECLRKKCRNLVFVKEIHKF